MKYALLALAALTTTASLAQSNVPVADVPLATKKFWVGVSYSPDVAYRSLNIVDPSEGMATVERNRNEFEKPNYGHTTGISFGHMLGKRIGIECGVAYSLKGYVYKIDVEKMTFGDYESIHVVD